jgi:hypothetical protein
MGNVFYCDFAFVKDNNMDTILDKESKDEIAFGNNSKKSKQL